MTVETALPQGAPAEAGQTETPEQIAATAALTEKNRAIDAADGTPEGEAAKTEEAPKKEKTADQREIERLRRRTGNLTRQKYDLRAELEQLRGGRQPTRAPETPANDDEPVTLSRAELQKMVAEQAQKLAPSISEQRAEIERRQGVVESLSKEWGRDEFDAKAADLEAVFNGLADAQGRPKPATDAIFEADDPKGVIEYLTDPDNADEAERIAKLPSARAVREIVRIEQKLKEAKANAKPKPSNAAKPIEAVKGGGVPTGMPDPSNTKAYIAWANAQERTAR